MDHVNQPIIEARRIDIEQVPHIAGMDRFLNSPQTQSQYDFEQLNRILKMFAANSSTYVRIQNEMQSVYMARIAFTERVTLAYQCFVLRRVDDRTVALDYYALNWKRRITPEMAPYATTLFAVKDNTLYGMLGAPLAG